MPWFVQESDGEYCVMAGTTDAPGEEVKCHPTKAEADAHVAEMSADMPKKHAGGLAVTDKTATGFELKSITEVPASAGDPGGWNIAGYFSVFDNVDMEGDIVRKGAFKTTLAERLPKIKDHHGVTCGQVAKAAEDDHGLYIEGRIYPTTAGRDLAILAQAIDTTHGKQAPVQEGSFGWRPRPGGMKRLKDGTRELTDIEVYEVSPVTHGMNPATRFGLVKGLDPDTGAYDGPVEGLLSETTRVITAAVRETETLALRRASAGRGLGAKHLDALQELTTVTADAVVRLCDIEAKAGRAVSNPRRRYLADMVKAVSRFLDSLPEGEREELMDMMNEEDGAAAGKSAAPVGAPDAPADSTEARNRELTLIQMRLAQISRGIPIARK